MNGSRVIIGFALIGIAVTVTISSVSIRYRSDPAHASSAVSSRQVADAVACPGTFVWPQFGFDSQHSGYNPSETTLTLSNVANLRQLFQVSLPSSSDGAPVYLSGVTTQNGVKNLILLTTNLGHILALDAATGVQVWSHQYSPTATCQCGNLPGPGGCGTNSSPAIDPNRQFVYSYGLDGFVHKYRVGDGVEVNGGGWPELITRKPRADKVSSPLSITTAANGVNYLYATTAANIGDCGDYQGHLTAVNLFTGAQHVFNAACSDQLDVHFAENPATPDCRFRGFGIWARASVVYNPSSDQIYLSTGNGFAGNGSFNPTNYLWGDSVLALRPDGTAAVGTPLDSYTPSNFVQLDNADQDVGSTAPAIMAVPANSAIKHLAVQGGKDGRLRLLNLDDLSGRHAPGQTGGEIFSITLPDQILTAPAVWVNPVDNRSWVFVTTLNSGIWGFQLSINGAGMPSLTQIWTTAVRGTSPIVANGVLYYASRSPVEIRALDPTNGSNVLFRASLGSIHWASPIVANGVLYIADGGTSTNGRLTAYSLNGAAPPPAQVPATTVQFSAANYNTNEGCAAAIITVNRSGDLSGSTSVDYVTSDAQAAQRANYTFAAGTLNFAPGESSKTFKVLLSKTAYAEGNQTLNVTLSNPTNCAVVGIQSTASVTIIDDPTIPPNSQPVDDAATLVCQHYHDFLAREPDPDGSRFWTQQITSCGSDRACIDDKRNNVSASFFLSIEFQQTGYLVERIYKSAYGDLTGTSTIGGSHQLSVPSVRLFDFLHDTEEIGQGVVVGQTGWESVLETNKQAFTADFVQRTRFATAYPTSMTPTQFVNQLFANAGLTPSDADRNAAIAEFGSVTNTSDVAARGRALRRVAENATLVTNEFNRAFVLMQYFGYLRRNPNDPPEATLDHSGYDFWLNKLNFFNGNYIQAEMVKAFITSIEYRQRFGS